jgi:TolB-like protein
MRDILEPMSSVGTDAEAALLELERVLASPTFARNDRQSRFLRFIVERHLEGKDQELKESLVAVNAFGRSPGYDPKQDPIVRTEASRLRARLSEYYLGEGKEDPLVIELPRGGYVPVFKRAVVIRESTTPSRWRFSRRSFAVAVACGVLSLAAVGWWRLRQQNAPIPIAVLPLINLNQDPAFEYFADGLTGEIIRNLSIIDGLAVRSETSSFAFKGQHQKAREAGKELDADYILEGSVQRSGQQLRINAQLVRVRDDFPLWSAGYDRELTDVFAIQDEISLGIVNSLRLKLGRGRRRYETSAEAYDLYLRGRAFEIRPALSGMSAAIPLFEETIAKDRSFAPGYAGLAVAYGALSGYDRFDQAERADLVSKMRAAGERAIKLDPFLAEAHQALGIVYAHDAQWEQSEKSFRRAIELDPNSSPVRESFVGSLLLPLNRTAEALAQVQLAARSDPLSAQVQASLARNLFRNGRFGEAVAHCEKPCIEGLLLSGKAVEAIPILEARFNGDLSRPDSGELGRAYALAGRRDEAERIAKIQWRSIEQAGIFVALGDKDRAFEALGRALPLGAVRVGRDLTHPEFVPLRGDPRLRVLRKQLGLPE